MDAVTAKVDEITELVERARAMPMSASCVVNRAELLELLDELRDLLPAELREAQSVLRDRTEILEQGSRRAERIVAESRVEAALLVSRTEVMQTATREATRLLEDARTEAATMRQDAEQYVDTKLANFEVVLHKTLQAVDRGREKLRGRMEKDVLGEDQLADDDTPLPT